MRVLVTHDTDETATVTRELVKTLLGVFPVTARICVATAQPDNWADTVDYSDIFTARDVSEFLACVTMFADELGTRAVIVSDGFTVSASRVPNLTCSYVQISRLRPAYPQWDVVISVRASGETFVWHSPEVPAMEADLHLATLHSCTALLTKWDALPAGFLCEPEPAPAPAPAPVPVVASDPACGKPLPPAITATVTELRAALCTAVRVAFATGAAACVEARLGHDGFRQHIRGPPYPGTPGELLVPWYTDDGTPALGVCNCLVPSAQRLRAVDGAFDVQPSPTCALSSSFYYFLVNVFGLKDSQLFYINWGDGIVSSEK